MGGIRDSFAEGVAAGAAGSNSAAAEVLGNPGELRLSLFDPEDFRSRLGGGRESLFVGVASMCSQLSSDNKGNLISTSS